MVQPGVGGATRGATAIAPAVDPKKKIVNRAADDDARDPDGEHRGGDEQRERDHVAEQGHALVGPHHRFRSSSCSASR